MIDAIDDFALFHSISISCLDKHVMPVAAAAAAADNHFPSESVRAPAGDRSRCHFLSLIRRDRLSTPRCD